MCWGIGVWSIIGGGMRKEKKNRIIGRSLALIIIKVFRKIIKNGEKRQFFESYVYYI